MTPAFTRREAQSLDSLLATAGGEGWSGLENREPTLAPRPMQPTQSVAELLAALARTPDGRAVIEWLMDITFRAPFRATGRTIEETALLAATRQGIEGVGEVILAAIAEGAASLERRHQEKDDA